VAVFTDADLKRELEELGVSRHLAQKQGTTYRYFDRCVSCVCEFGFVGQWQQKMLADADHVHREYFATDA
jgi:hypothetical protein